MTHQELYDKVGRIQVKSAYQRYSDYFKSISMDYKDVEQEILIDLWEILQSEKERKNIAAYAYKAVQLKLKNMVMSASHSILSGDLILFCNKGDEDKEPLEILSNIKQKISKLEYQILYKKFIEDKNLLDISKEVNETYMVLSHIYRKLINKFAKEKNLTNYVVTHKRLEDISPKSQHLTQDEIVDLHMWDESAINLKKELDLKMLMEKAKEKLSDEEYEVFNQKIIKNQTFEEIGKVRNYSRQYAKVVYNKALVKVKQLF